MKNATKSKNDKIKDYETIIGMISKALDELVHACEAYKGYENDNTDIVNSCTKAKELLPFCQPKED